MGRGILCMGNTAKTPYFLQKPGISVYTVEELCYCIRESTFLMDEGMVCRELADWLREECGLAELADSLYGLLKKKASAGAFLAAILEYTGYYPREEIARVEQFLKTESGLSEHERRKRAADYLAGGGKCELALERYRELLCDMPGLEDAFRAKIYHNMGYVSSRLFLFEQAAVYFETAYRLSGERESLWQFLGTKRMLLKEEEYVDLIAGKPQEYYEASMELEKLIEQAAEEWKTSDEAAELETLQRCGAARQADASERQGAWNDEKELDDMLADVGERLKAQYRSMVREK